MAGRLGNNKDNPVLANMIFEKNGDKAFLIDQIRETEEEVKVSSTKIAVDGDTDGVADYYFSYPHLAVLVLEDSSYGYENNGYEDDEYDDDEYDDGNGDENDYVGGNCKLNLKVWNIEKSPTRPLYSIYIEDMLAHPFHQITEATILLKNNLIRVATLTKSYVFDAATIEDRDSVLKSKREFSLDEAYDVILVNKFLCVSKLYNSITFYNFWK